MPKEKSVNLYFSEGSSDKVYNAQLVEADGGWRVLFQYGRRGKALSSGEKTNKGPVDYDKASKIYDKLVLSKTSKGYTPEEDGVAFAGTDNAGRVTGFRPQLLNEVTRKDSLTWHENASDLAGWYVQEKHDGERRGILLKDGQAIFANRKGLEVGVQQPIHDACVELARMTGDAVIDAEDMGDHVVIFDIIEADDIPADTPFSRRAQWLGHLASLIEKYDASDVFSTIKVDVPEAAIKFFEGDGPAELAQLNAEGYVLRSGNSAYAPGRPKKGGDALKVKFTESATCRVARVNDKRSVGMEVMDDEGAWTSVGNVTIPSNRDIPNVGDLIEVSYLYAFRDGAIFQPQYKGLRADLDADACTMSQLKLKGGEKEAASDLQSLDM